MTVVKIGNLFESTAHTLVNTVNCVGVMGKGIAFEFKKRYPAMFKDYANRCKAGLVKLGEPYYFSDLLGISIINFPTKKHWRSVSRLQDIEDGLQYFVDHYQEWGIQSVAFPPLGCGNGGLDWEQVGPLMYSYLSSLPISIEIYAPFGTPAKELTVDFLQNTALLDSAIKGSYPQKMRDEWLALFEIVYQLSKQSYAIPVGRTIFQKIGYIMTELGIDTGFTFQRGSYGPFSKDIKTALTVAANANLIREVQLGHMTALVTTEEFENKRTEYLPRIARYQKWIDKTVDLFSRIKNTDQAEEVTTVIYTAKELKKFEKSGKVSEEDVLSFISEWKKQWANEKKIRSIASTIRNLQMLSWIKLEYSESLPYDTP
jgi:O-acetyl-ADP-ribose deacetylase (regulator of RNase III)/uncharacterized protein YwgA